jgi:hypothetical protein
MIERVVFALGLITLSAMTFKWKNFSQFTFWGIYFTTITFILLSIHELRFSFDKRYRRDIKSHTGKMFK